VSRGTEGPRDWLGILLGRGKRRQAKPGKKGCIFPCLVVLATAAAGLVVTGHQAMGLSPW